MLPRFTSSGDREIDAFLEFGEHNLSTSFGYAEHSIRGKGMSHVALAVIGTQKV
jgi:hypothetical protein